MGLRTDGEGPDGEGPQRRKMNAKKLIVGLVTAVSLTLFGGAAYAQQLAAPQEDDAARASSSSAHHKECDRTHEHRGQAQAT
jgi:hypothetical protein